MHAHLNFCRLLYVSAASRGGANGGALGLMCVPAASTTSHTTLRGGPACRIMALHAGFAAISVSKIPSSFHRIAAKPQTGEITEGLRHGAVRGSNRSRVAASEKYSCRFRHSARQKFKRTVSVSLTHTEFAWRFTVGCAGVSASNEETRPFRREVASVTPTALVPMELPELGFPTVASTPRHGFFIGE